MFTLLNRTQHSKCGIPIRDFVENLQLKCTSMKTAKAQKVNEVGECEIFFTILTLTAWIWLYESSKNYIVHYNFLQVFSFVFKEFDWLNICFGGLLLEPNTKKYRSKYLQFPLFKNSYEESHLLGICSNCFYKNSLKKNRKTSIH